MVATATTHGGREKGTRRFGNISEKVSGHFFVTFGTLSEDTFLGVILPLPSSSLALALKEKERRRERDGARRQHRLFR